MANFKTRHLPQSYTQASNAVEMSVHLQADDPHPQYVTRAEWNGGSGSIVLNGYVLTSTYNTFVTGYTNWKTDTVDPAIVTVNALSNWKTSTDTWKSGIDSWKTNTVGPAITTVSNLSTWKTNTADPAIQDITQLRSEHDVLDGKVSDHLNTSYTQTYSGVIPLHVDNQGRELYARRLHTHTLTDFNAAAADHNHDNIYLKIDDIDSDRTTPNGTTVSALSSIFATKDHSHAEYVNQYELAEVGIYPSANNPFYSEDIPITTFDFNKATEQGIFSLHPQSGQSVLNAPVADSTGLLVVFENQSIYGENGFDSNDNIVITTAGVRNIQQLHIGENGIIRKRTITATDAIAYGWVSSTDSSIRLFTKTATGTASLAVYDSSSMYTALGTTTAGSASAITYDGTVYDRDAALDRVGVDFTYGSWHIVSAPGRVKAVTNSGTSYAMDCATADIHNLTLNNNCTLSVSNLTAGQTAFLYVNADGIHTLKYNGVTLISAVDSGRYRIEFQHDGAAVRCINVMVILA